jgi:hypothetical protein
LYSYYNSSRTLCIKCWDSAFRSEISYNFLILRIPRKEGLGGEGRPKDRVNLQISLLYPPFNFAGVRCSTHMLIMSRVWVLLVRIVFKSQIDSRWSMTLWENRLVVSYSVGRVFAFVSDH